MRALTVEPWVAGSTRLDVTTDTAPDTATRDSAGGGPARCVVDTLLVGVCGTDAEIVAGEYGVAPPGDDRLVLGHEAVGRVSRAAQRVVRRSDSSSCRSCADPTPCRARAAPSASGTCARTVGTPSTCPTPDIVVECTGAGSVVLDAMEHTSRTGIVCLAGISSGSRSVELDPAALNRRLVLENVVVFGTVNANRRHYEAAVDALAAADATWLERVVSRRVPLAAWEDALEDRDGDVKVVLDVTA